MAGFLRSVYDSTFGAGLNLGRKVANNVVDGGSNALGQLRDGVFTTTGQVKNGLFDVLGSVKNATTSVISSAYDRTGRATDSVINMAKTTGQRGYDRAAGTINNAKKLGNRGYDRAAGGISGLKSVGKHLGSKAGSAFSYGNRSKPSTSASQHYSNALKPSQSNMPGPIVREMAGDINDVTKGIAKSIDNVSSNIINLFDMKKAA